MALSVCVMSVVWRWVEGGFRGLVCSAQMCLSHIPEKAMIPVAAAIVPHNCLDLSGDSLGPCLLTQGDQAQRTHLRELCERSIHVSHISLMVLCVVNLHGHGIDEGLQGTGGAVGIPFQWMSPKSRQTSRVCGLETLKRPLVGNSVQCRHESHLQGVICVRQVGQGERHDGSLAGNARWREICYTLHVFRGLEGTGNAGFGREEEEEEEEEETLKG